MDRLGSRTPAKLAAVTGRVQPAFHHPMHPSIEKKDGAEPRADHDRHCDRLEHIITLQPAFDRPNDAQQNAELPPVLVKQAILQLQLVVHGSVRKSPAEAGPKLDVPEQGSGRARRVPRRIRPQPRERKSPAGAGLCGPPGTGFCSPHGLAHGGAAVHKGAPEPIMQPGEIELDVAQELRDAQSRILVLFLDGEALGGQAGDARSVDQIK